MGRGEHVCMRTMRQRVRSWATVVAIAVWILPAAAIWSLGQEPQPRLSARAQLAAGEVAEPVITFSAIKMVTAAIAGVAGVFAALYAGAQKLVRPWIGEEVARHAETCPLTTMSSMLTSELREQLRSEQANREEAQTEHRQQLGEMQRRIDEVYRMLVETKR